MDFKRHFSRSIGRTGAPLHFAAHSHHPWPDVTFEAQQRYWLDSAELLDGKWSRIFGRVIPQAQAHAAKRLGVSDPNTIVFSPSTHALLMRLLSATPGLPKFNVLSTDSEFHSFTRQMDRLREDDLVNIVRVPTEPFATFKDRFIAELRGNDEWDIVWLSHVFFNSGWVAPYGDLVDIVAAIRGHTTFAVVDGYHAFMAIPLDISAMASRAFYIAGGYKYAMTGEGACFMHCPPGYGERPRDTGWYAEFGALEHARKDQIAFGADASRFSGATFDPSGLYRFNAVMDWLDGLGVDVAAMDNHCLELQRYFLKRLDAADIPLSSRLLRVRDVTACGRFLTFRTDEAERLDRELRKRNVIVDHRGNSLRIGFGIYQDERDVDRLVATFRDLG